jgi:hypothetical protein
MKHILSLIIIFFFNTLEHKATANPVIEPLEMMSLIKEVLPGKYQTSMGSQIDPNQSKNDDLGTHHLTTIIKSLTNPKLGKNLYYLEEFRDNNPLKVTRIRVYKFWAQEDNVYLKLLNPINTDNLVGSHNNLQLAENLSESDIKPDRDVCILSLSSFHSKIIARMRTRKCDREDTWIDYELIIGKQGMWTCFARRDLKNDSLVWLQMLDSPCIYQTKVSNSS